MIGLLMLCTKITLKDESRQSNQEEKNVSSSDVQCVTNNPLETTSAPRRQPVRQASTRNSPILQENAAKKDVASSVQEVPDLIESTTSLAIVPVSKSPLSYKPNQNRETLAEVKGDILKEPVPAPVISQEERLKKIKSQGSARLQKKFGGLRNAPPIRPSNISSTSSDNSQPMANENRSKQLNAIEEDAEQTVLSLESKENNKSSTNSTEIETSTTAVSRMTKLQQAEITVMEKSLEDPVSVIEKSTKVGFDQSFVIVAV
jgi:hypothetical protein